VCNNSVVIRIDEIMKITLMFGHAAPWLANWNMELTNIRSYDEKKFKNVTSIPYVVVAKNVVKDVYSMTEGALTGIDIPVLISKEDKEKKVIAVIGEAPQRNFSDFERHKAHNCNDVLIGTPYAAHYSRFRRSVRGRAYWSIFEALIDTYDVYLTDYHKVYTGGTLPDGDVELLNEELKRLKPAAVVTFGARASGCLGLKGKMAETDIFTNPLLYSCNGLSIPFVPMVHPSGRVDKKQRNKFFEINGVSDSDKNPYVELIEKALRPIRS